MELSKFKAASRVPSTSLPGLKLMAMLLLCGCAAKPKVEKLPFYNTADFTAEWIKRGDKGYDNIHKIGKFSFCDQLGHTFTNESLKGKVYTANFFFTICTSICPPMMHNLKKLQDSFFKDERVQMISFSVMPGTDSVAQLAAYGQRMEINPMKWHLLTGDEQAINTLGRQSFFAEKKEGLKKEATEFLHTQAMLLIDQQSRIRGVYDATLPGEIDKAAADIKMLLEE